MYTHALPSSEIRVKKRELGPSDSERSILQHRLGRVKWTAPSRHVGSILAQGHVEKKPRHQKSRQNLIQFPEQPCNIMRKSRIKSYWWSHFLQQMG